ncbi:aspartate/glutamate racemase family protein [Acidiferrimicrobium sp. IK]|uniref:aspartate/glutamate racemase family protein n=1 Tax=Acidiferrimicrobium sp. IK TaxID=2871700 RepID=UPI0021CB4BDF|nr:aspartate/glutamate racemase family protein [Acidiferrimicrobium sp. IK]MCU4186753.1 aspartate/glutamate racemase family protein [Acidiferrimicrobium sp. IK]
MLRVKAVAPLRLTPEELGRRQDRYDRLGGGQLAITLVNLTGDGAPSRFDTADQIAASERLTAEEIRRSDPSAFDIVLPDCVLDPAVGEVAAPPVPVAGILQLVTAYLASIGRPFAAVTRNRAIGDELSRKVERYGLARWLTGVHVLDVDFCLVSDHQGWADAMRPLQKQLEADGVNTLFNGCSAVDIDADHLGSVAVVDPTALALQLLCLMPPAGPERERPR